MPNLSSILSLDDDTTKQVAENDAITSSDISTANIVTPANNISTVNCITTANNVAFANDISTANNDASANDISTANNDASANDISIVNYITTANNVASANDIKIKKNVQGLKFTFNLENGKTPKKSDCRPNIVDKCQPIVNNTINESYKLRRKIVLPEVKPQVNFDEHNKYLFQVANSVAKNSSLFVKILLHDLILSKFLIPV